MKPLILTIEGLHSFTKRQSIDFRELGVTGLFGIFGPTGSGKSSILDAITLALYGEVKRATRKTQGIINSQQQKLEVVFTFEIGILPKRYIYRVERSFRRIPDNRDAIRASVCRLIQLHQAEERILAEGTAAVNQAIIGIIGLNMDDFTRSVVLPQGEFAQFLKLSNADRVQMLERIFALDDYGSKLSEQVKVERGYLEQELLKVETVILEQGEVSLELLAKLQSELNLSEQEKVKLWQEDEAFKVEYHAASQTWQYQQELAQIQLTESLHLKQQPAVNQAKQSLAAAVAAESLRPYLTAWRRATKAVVAATTELKLKQTTFEGSQVQTKILAEQYQELEKNFQSKQPVLIGLQARLEGLLETEVELAKKLEQRAELREDFRQASLRFEQNTHQLQAVLTEQASLSSAANELQLKLEQAQVELSSKEQIRMGLELEKEYQRLQAETRRAKQELEQSAAIKSSLEQGLAQQETEKSALSTELANWEANFARLIANKPGDLELLMEKSQELTLLEKQLEAVSRGCKTLEQEQQALLQAEQETTKVATQAKVATDAVVQAKNELSRAESEQVALERALKDYETTRLAAQLATELTPKTPCPVCGATEHPAPVHFELNEQYQLAYTKQQAQVVKLQGIWQMTQQKETKLLAELQFKQENLQRCQELVTKHVTELEDLQASLPPAYREVAVAKELLLTEKESLTNFQTRLTQWEQEKQSVEANVAKIKAAQAKLEAQQMAELGKLTVIGENLAKQQEILTTQESVTHELLLAYQQRQTVCRIENFTSEHQRLVTLETEVQRLRQNFEQLNLKLQTLSKKLEALKTVSEELNLQKNEVEVAGKVLSTEIKEKEEQIAKLTDGRRVTEVLVETRQQLQELIQIKQAVQIKYETAQVELTELNRSLAELEKQVQIYELNLKTTQSELEKGLAETGLATAELAEAGLLTVAQRSELEQEIGRFEETARHLKSQITTLQEKLGGRFLETEQWEIMQQSAKAFEQAKEELLAQRAALELRLQESTIRYQKVLAYQKERRQLAKRKSLADELAKVLQGNALVSYLAEEQLRYILQDASLRLGMLTNQRYQLELGEQKDFAIRDNINGGLLRPAGSLSGGETFLVSLALALALSSQIQLKGVNPLEFFFLDEGFGTLDPHLLEIVMDSLEKLRQGNLLIGVISHVPELKERISRRLFVTPAGLDGSGSQVVLNKA